jgi:hypothetical protein
VKFIKLIHNPDLDLIHHGSDEDGETASHKSSHSQQSSSSTQNANNAKKRKQLLLNSYQDGPMAVVPCVVRKSTICCDIPWMGDDATPMRVELYLDGLRVNEVVTDIDHIRYQIPFPSRPTYSTIDIEYAGSFEDPPPEPPDDEEATEKTME